LPRLPEGQAVGGECLAQPWEHGGVTTEGQDGDVALDLGWALAKDPVGHHLAIVGPPHTSRPLEELVHEESW